MVCEGARWIELAQDRGQWRSLVSAALNFRTATTVVASQCDIHSPFRDKFEDNCSFHGLDPLIVPIHN